MNRPSRSQQHLLEYIAQFVRQHGYGPSYREIMRALDYKSISTVAIHINGLVAKGSLKKQGRSARSLEVVKAAGKIAPQDKSNPETWLLTKIEAYAASPEADQVSLQAMARVFGQLGITTAQAKAESHLRQ